MKNTKAKQIVETAVSFILFGLTIYAAYSLWYIFYGADSGADVHLYTGLTGLCLGWFMSLFVGEVLPKTGIIGKLIAFFAGNGLLHGFIWGVNAKINESIT